MPYCRPGASTAGLPEVSTAESSSVDRLKPLIASTQMVMMPAPAMSSTALMICTQVVPFMPPTST